VWKLYSHCPQGANNIPAVAWLLGVVMPLETTGGLLNGDLEELMFNLQMEE